MPGFTSLLSLVLPSVLLTGDARINDLAPGDHTFTLEHGGRQRRYMVHIPRNLRRGPASLVIALHGGGGHGKQFKEANGLDAVADAQGFIVAYPDGTGRMGNRLLTWNAGVHCCGYAREQNVDDVGFLARVIGDIGERTPIDAGRVYMTGHSNGAIMAYRFAAERADLVTAIVPVAGAMDVERFAPVRDVAVLHIHSVDDPRALYAGGMGPPFPGTDTRIHHEPVRTGLDRWAVHNGCGALIAVGQVLRGTGSDRGQSATRLAAQGCRSGGTVEHLRLEQVGHGWPGTTARGLMRRTLGRDTGLIEASREVWSFVSQFSR